MGITEEQLHHLPDYRSSEVFGYLEKLVLEYATTMTETPVEVPNELFERVRDQFDDEQLVELTATIAWENYRSRFNHALGVESQDFSDGAFCALPERAGAVKSQRTGWEHDGT
jgi:alkylhydroperoxidase family enzyme